MILSPIARHHRSPRTNALRTGLPSRATFTFSFRECQTLLVKEAFGSLFFVT